MRDQITDMEDVDESQQPDQKQGERDGREKMSEQSLNNGRRLRMIVRLELMRDKAPPTNWVPPAATIIAPCLYGVTIRRRLHRWNSEIPTNSCVRLNMTFKA